jgi:hypothetical protein
VLYSAQLLRQRRKATLPRLLGEWHRASEEARVDNTHPQRLTVETVVADGICRPLEIPLAEVELPILPNHREEDLRARPPGTHDLEVLVREYVSDGLPDHRH